MVYPSPKDPNDITDFSIDWSARLGTPEVAATETIATIVSAIPVAPSDVVVSSSAISGNKTIHRITGGTVPIAQQVRVRITTNTGRQLDETMSFSVKEN